MIRILITDDHKLMREGLKKIIAEEQDMSIVGEARNADEALDYVREHVVDIVLLDISMPGRSGLDVLPSLKQTQPNAQVVMLSMHNDARLANRALANGASAYVNKDAAADELVDAIRGLFTPVV
ncbi:MAG: response regulator transcription factor [Chloroflexi bacterium]|nr:response regulator transcription factor [Chloroflexota bacterium]